MPAKRTLVNLALVGPVKWHAEVLELDNGLRRLAAHEFDGILVAEPVGPLDGVVHMPMPMIFLGVAQRRRNSPLRSNGVRTRWKDLGQHSGFQPCFGKLYGGTQSGTAGTDDHCIKFAYGNG